MCVSKPPSTALPHWRLTRLRRRVFWIFVVAYAVAMPMLLLFAFGIRYSEGKPPVATGSLEVSTIPSGAHVSLQGQFSPGGRLRIQHFRGGSANMDRHGRITTRACLFHR